MSAKAFMKTSKFWLRAVLSALVVVIPWAFLRLLAPKEPVSLNWLIVLVVGLTLGFFYSCAAEFANPIRGFLDQHVSAIEMVRRTVLLVVFILALIVWPIEAGQRAFSYLWAEENHEWLVAATVLISFVLGGSAAFLLSHFINYVFSGLVERHQSTTQKQEIVFERLEILVLFLGVGAGVAVGIFVGIDALEQLRERDFYHLLTKVLAPGAVSGLILAILVAVGSIVLIFEKRIAKYLETGSQLTDAAVTAAQELQTLKPDVVNSLTALQNLAHALVDVRETLKDTDPDFVLAEGNYLRAWLKTVNAKPTISQVARAIATSYWNEEASDISRLKLVTNSRNYTGFLIAAVRASQKLESKDKRQLHFYTVTPAGPRSLLNWPQLEGTDADGLTFHRDALFVSSYMLFIRELVSSKSIVHRRWIWPDEIKSEFRHQDVQHKFGSWHHYAREAYFTTSSDVVLGVPIELEELRKKLDNPADLARALKCSADSCGQGIADWITKWGTETEKNGAFEACCYTVQPVVPPNFADYSGWEGIVREQRSALCQRVAKDLEVLCQLAEKCARRAREENKPFRVLESVRPDVENVKTKLNTRESLQAVADLLLWLQEVEAALSISVEDGDLEATVSAIESKDSGSLPADLKDPSKVAEPKAWWRILKRVEASLVRLKSFELWDKWRESKRDEKGHLPGKLPLWNDYFSEAFHSDHGPHFPGASVLRENRKVFGNTGPEFAILAVEPADGQVFKLRLKEEDKEVGVLLALRSSIASPWEWGEIEVILPSEPERTTNAALKSFVEATQKLIDGTPDDKWKLR